MHPDSTLSINAVEAFTLDSFDPELVRTSLAEANVKLSTSKDAYTQAEAKIQIEVLSAIQYALSH
ncbi:delta subunit of the central stalk of mitochondrial F1F0 ATP synthase, atp16 [Coelomomyces lativittatus]|nr:delta subunit of the central stalk of mitochondrial F1F0 ATP synthase, atp16 [Coelomomyces lativittatus]KAJ1509747.1 delta subunit of the central stalk of mitochondrial F1F0 ATP synthase, atp16 [Coelomomyces lativittatus]